MLKPRFLRTGYLLALTAWCALVSGCVLDRSAERAFLSGDPGTALEFLDVRATEARNDLALQESLRGTVALVSGDYHTARDSLITAGQIMGSFPETGAREIAAIIGDEATKHYLGDPYEALLNSFYTAIALLQKGDEQNARAALKSGILADSDSEEEEYKSDALGLYLLEALLSFRSGAVDLARRDVEQVNALDPDHPFASERYLRSANTLIVVDWGIGPQKVATGRYGELVNFRLPYSPECGASLRIDGKGIGAVEPSVDVDFQARTRGGRPMDYILGGKAVFKELAETAGHIALNESAHRRDRKLAALGATLLGLSLLVQARADTRHWHLLPAHVGLWIGRVEPGLHSIGIDFLDKTGRRLEDYRQEWHYLPIHDSKLNVYYFRSGYHKGFRRDHRAGKTHAENRRENPS